MPSYTIDYLWNYNPHGPDGSPCMDREVPLKVRYHIQPDEPDVGLESSVALEEILQDGIPLCTDADKECGWYASDEQRLLDWLLDGEWRNGMRA
jgi:hypothetical protein